MSRVCEVCGKRPHVGRSIARRGLPKKTGGIGLKTTGISARVFYPNLKRVRAMIKKSVRTIRVCTKCLKAGKIVKARPHRFPPSSK
jgi:large subunit ribosomal protein L28